MPAGPLDDPRLREVEACLNEARFEEAQRKLVGLGGVRDLGPGVAYLTTRLLAQRGKLDPSAVAERLRDVLTEAPDFPEARDYLLALGRGAALDAFVRAPTLTAGPRSVPVPMPSIPPSSKAVVSGAPPSKHPPSLPEEPDRIVTDSPFPESPQALAARRGARPPVLETPRVPPPAPAKAAPRPLPALGGLEPPRSEMPTEPAPPPSESLELEHVRFEPEPASVAGRGLWDPVELDLASGRVEAALSAIEKQAGTVLDALVARQMPRLEAVAERAADFLATTPIICHFPPFDLSPGSLARLDAALLLFARRPQRAPRYALSVLLSAYVGECVRRGSGGTWVGRLAEPDMATIERGRADTYVPWRAVQLAMTEGRAMGVAPGGSGRAARPESAEPPRPASAPPTAWDPAPWPDFGLYCTIGRVVPGSVLGTWAARILQTPLDRSFASLTAIDHYLSLLATSAVPPDASGGWARRAAVLTGAYVGEVLCLQAGAQWAENEAAPFGPLRFELVTPDGGAAYPVLWSLERVRGHGRSIADRVRALLV